MHMILEFIIQKDLMYAYDLGVHYTKRSIYINMEFTFTKDLKYGSGHGVYNYGVPLYKEICITHQGASTELTDDYGLLIICRSLYSYLRQDSST